jgi:succinoglycan biosynthesis transport protein ExoP
MVTTVDFRETWNLVRSHWVTVLTFALLGCMIAAAYVLTTVPKYTAETELFVAVDGGDSTAELAQGSNYSQQQARNYSAVVSRQVVLEPVITALGLRTTPAELAKHISASVPLNTSLISISVSDTSPNRAAAIANAVATSLTNTVVKLVPARSDGTSPIELQSIQTASVPTEPSEPNSRLSLAFGLLGGLLAGVALVVLRERVRTKVRSVDQVKTIEGLSILGSIIYDRRALTRPMLSDADGGTRRAEEFRQLRTNLRFLQTDSRNKAFVVTSSIHGEGKSTTAANIAATLAASGSSVCLVEADLRKPVLAEYLDLQATVGMTTVITNEARLDDALHTWGPHNMKVLLSGEIPPNPSELLGSRQTENLLKTITERFDVTIIDCPPLLPVTDAALLAKSLGGAILVVGTGRVEVRELRRAVETLTTAGAPILGAVVNMIPARRGRGSEYARVQQHGQAKPPANARRKASPSTGFSH